MTHFLQPARLDARSFNGFNHHRLSALAFSGLHVMNLAGQIVQNLADAESDLELQELARDMNLPMQHEIEAWVRGAYQEFSDAILPKGDTAFLEIHGRAHEDVSQILRMYERYAHQRGWAVEVIDSDALEPSQITIRVTGRNALRHFVHESGNHRLEFRDSNSRTHTHVVSVAVFSNQVETDLQIKTSDILEYRMGGTGPGGQNVNKTQCGVRLVHRPTGTSVTIRNERSLEQNRGLAMSILLAKLREQKEAGEGASRAEAKLDQIGFGRKRQSTRIRTYDFERAQVVDHMLDVELSLDEVLGGALESWHDSLNAHAVIRYLERLLQ